MSTADYRARLPADISLADELSGEDVVEMANLTFAVYAKSGNLLLGPVDTGTLWDGFVIPDCTDPSRKIDPMYLYTEANENVQAYGITTHRHTPEMEQELSALAGAPVVVGFTPHRVPLNRGIFTTASVPLAPGSGKKTAGTADLPIGKGKFINLGEWNQIHIIAHGHQLTHIVNGHVMAILIDDDQSALKTKGAIALQIEQYGMGRISFRNIWLKQ